MVDRKKQDSKRKLKKQGKSVSSKFVPSTKEQPKPNEKGLFATQAKRSPDKRIRIAKDGRASNKETSLFFKLRDAAKSRKLKPRTKEAQDWFRNQIKGMGKINRTLLLRDRALLARQKTFIGKMFMYVYDPKHKETLPYYDKFPLIIALGPAKDGFFGINMHYLSPLIRAAFLDKLYQYGNNKRYDDSYRLKITYEFLKASVNHPEFRPCLKHYLMNHIESRIVLIEPKFWDIAIFLPTEQFVGASKEKVWGDSNMIIANAFNNV